MSHELTIKQRRNRRKRRHAVLNALLMSLLLAVIVTVLRMASDYLLPQIGTQENMQPTAGTVKQPAVLKSGQIENALRQYAATNQAAAQIYENRSRYPENLLAAYVNNPEMEDFIAGYLNADVSQHGELNQKEKSQEYPLLLQWDKRWGYAAYGESIIGLSGCGPTCLSMVLVTLTGNKEYTPDKVAGFSEANGYYVQGSGTAWSLMTDGASKLGLAAKELPLAESVMKTALDNGQPIICSMGAGDFTTQGHFILLRGYNEDGFFVNDPNCIARSSQVWSYEKLQGQIKNLWSYQIS